MSEYVSNTTWPEIVERLHAAERIAICTHTNPDGDGPGGRLDANGVSYRGAGENIYWASWSASAEQAMDAWMNSPGHHDNLLRAGWTHTGIGVHEGSGGSWWTQVFITR